MDKQESITAEVKIGPIDDPLVEMEVNLNETGKNTGTFSSSFDQLSDLVETGDRQLHLFYQDNEDKTDTSISSVIVKEAPEKEMKFVNKEGKINQKTNLDDSITKIVLKDKSLNKSEKLADYVKDALIVINTNTVNNRMKKMSLRECDPKNNSIQKNSEYFCTEGSSLKEVFHKLSVEKTSNLQFVYVDPFNKSDLSVLPAAKASEVSTNSTLSTVSGKSDYKIGEEIGLILEDKDQNKRPDKTEQVEIYFSNEKGRRKIALHETGNDTGIFKRSGIRLARSAGKDKIAVPNRDHIKFIYEDPKDSSDKSSLTLSFKDNFKSEISFVDGSGSKLQNFSIPSDDSNIFIKVWDQDQNKDARDKELLKKAVTLIFPKNNKSVKINLWETEKNSGEFKSKPLKLSITCENELSSLDEIALKAIYNDPTDQKDSSKSQLKIKPQCA
ncbi:MAG: hypothetical protein V5A57_02915 [Candidatus Paceibacterota bacterium]